MGNLIIRRGATYDQPLTLGMDLTGATVYFTAKSEYDDDTTDTTAVLKKDITTHDDALTGISRLALSSDETSIAPGTYKGDLHVKKDGVVTAFEPFSVIIKPSVTLRS